MSRVLVTGASGFVGGPVCAALQAAGHAVSGTGRSRPLPPGVEAAAIGEIGPDTDWTAALAGVEAVVHSAARVHVMRDAATDPLAEFRRVNRDGTLALAEQAVTAGVRHLLFLSTIKVNGEGTAPGRPYGEADAPNPQDPYGVSKAEAEAGLRDLAARTGLAVTILRPTLVYGPGAVGNLAQLLGVLARGLPLPFGAVTGNRRSLVAVDNLASAVAACIGQPPAAGECRLFLMADPQPLSTAALIRLLAEGMGRPARLLPVPPALMLLAARLLGKGAVAQRLLGNLEVDGSAIRRALDWTPPVATEDGLRAMARDWSLTK